jgi:hypothetical protein
MLTYDYAQATIAARNWVTDTVAFGGVEKQHLVRLGDRLLASKMADEHAAIREYQLRGARELLDAQIATSALAIRIRNSYSLRSHERSGDDLCHETLLLSAELDVV